MTEHYHVWTSAITGAEYANAVYDNDVDAALDYLGIVLNLTKYTEHYGDVNIQMVMESLRQGKGMYAGTPGLVAVLSRCEGGCISPTWN